MKIRKCWRVSSQDKIPTATNANTETSMRSVRQPKCLCLRLKSSAVTGVMTAQTPAAKRMIKKAEMPLNKKPAKHASRENPEASTKARPADAKKTATIRMGFW